MRPFVMTELESARHAESLGRSTRAFVHLERAHILGQHSTRLHVLVHWQMLRFGIYQRDCREVFGQLWRIVAAAATTRFGLLPTGNTGGSNVSGFKVMNVPADLQACIDAARQASKTVRIPNSPAQ